MTLAKLWIVMCASCLFTADRAIAQLFVDQNAPVGGVHDGSTWAKAFFDVQPALDVAGGVPSLDPRKDVLVAEGTYLPTTSYNQGGGIFTRSLAFIMKPEVRLHGGFLGNASPTPSIDPDAPDGSYNRTVLSGNHPGDVRSYHVIVSDIAFTLVPVQVIIDGFRIKKGLADRSADNQDKGGGLFNWRAVTLVENVRFRNNDAIFGGGAYHQGHNGQFGIKTSVFRTNDAVNGAGLFIGSQSDEIKLCNVRFRENGDMDGGMMTLLGGGIYIDIEVNIEAANCVFDNNEAELGGGGIYADPDNFGNGDLHEWRHCTIAFNRVGPIFPLSGAGVHYASGDLAEKVFIDNCILWNNINGLDLFVAGGPMVDLKYSFSDIGTASGGTDSGGNLSVDPLFVDPPNGNFRLSSIMPGTPFSPCIDFGSDALIGTDFLDIEGNGVFGAEPLPLDKDLKPRLVDFPSINGSNAADMGAYEAPPVLPAIEK